MPNLVATNWNASYWSEASDFAYDQIMNDLYNSIPLINDLEIISYQAGPNSITGQLTDGASFNLTGQNLDTASAVISNFYLDGRPSYFLNLAGSIAPFTFTGNISFFDLVVFDTEAIFYGNLNFGYSSINGSISRIIAVL